MRKKSSENGDIFDRIMAWRPLRILQPFYKKYKEVLLYLFFGGLTFFLSIFLYWLFAHPLGLTPLVANVICWVLCVAFAYVTNRTWVFQDKAREPKGIVKEAAAFAAGRLATLALEELILWLGISVLGFPDVPVKVVAQVLVIVGNYVISKFFVFRKQQ
jgi:putative flippase GtrA